MGYVEKRIRLRKTRYQMMQKLAESRKKTVTVALDSEMEHAPRQTVRFCLCLCKRRQPSLTAAKQYYIRFSQSAADNPFARDVDR